MTSQLQLLNKIIQTKDYSIISTHNLTVDQFYNYPDEFNFIQNHFKAYQTVPDKLTFTEAFPDFDFVEVNEPESYLLEQLIKDYKASYLAAKFNKIKKLLESDKSEEAFNLYMESKDSIHTNTTLKCTDLTTDKGRYDRYLERIANPDKAYITTGFDELDSLIGGLDPENENMVIAARTGIGKTQTLLKMATAAALQGKVVGIYEGEMSADKVGYRIDTFLGHIENMSLNRGDGFIQQKYKNYIENLALQKMGPIKVLTPTDINGPATVSAIQAFVEQEGIQVLFIDQYSLLEDQSHSKSSWERVGNISKDIKNLQVMKKIPIVSVAQMNRTKNEDGSQDTTQIGLADRIGQDATVILMLDRKDDKLVFNIVKARDGGDNKKLTYRANFNLGTFEYIPEGTSKEEAKELEDSYAIKPNTSNVF